MSRPCSGVRRSMRMRGGNGDGIIGEQLRRRARRDVRLDPDDIGGDKGAVSTTNALTVGGSWVPVAGALRAANPAIANPGGGVISTFDTPTSTITSPFAIKDDVLVVSRPSRPAQAG